VAAEVYEPQGSARLELVSGVIRRHPGPERYRNRPGTDVGPRVRVRAAGWRSVAGAVSWRPRRARESVMGSATRAGGLGVAVGGDGDRDAIRDSHAKGQAGVVLACDTVGRHSGSSPRSLVRRFGVEQAHRPGAIRSVPRRHRRTAARPDPPPTHLNGPIPHLPPDDIAPPTLSLHRVAPDPL
jgi:hypothetical protein